jgi:curved DNA-binding protein CbpA
MQKIDGVDPMKVLGLQPNFTLDELKNAYKRVALTAHPDRGGSKYLFNLVSACYKQLRDTLQYKLPHEMKQTYKEEVKQQVTPSMTADKFDVDRFNKIFSEHHEVERTGYDDFLKKTKPIDEPKDLFKGKKVSANTFNEVFDKYAKTASSQTHISKYKDPEPLSLSTKIGFSDIGMTAIDDYSGDNRTNKNLNFMDLKVAHTTGRLIDPNIVKARQSFKSLEDVQKHRVNISLNMSDDEKRYHENALREKEIEERKRLQYIRDQDIRNAEKYSKLNYHIHGVNSSQS